MDAHHSDLPEFLVRLYPVAGTDPEVPECVFSLPVSGKDKDCVIQPEHGLLYFGQLSALIHNISRDEDREWNRMPCSPEQAVCERRRPASLQCDPLP